MVGRKGRRFKTGAVFAFFFLMQIFKLSCFVEFITVGESYKKGDRRYEYEMVWHPRTYRSSHIHASLLDTIPGHRRPHHERRGLFYKINRLTGETVLVSGLDQIRVLPVKDFEQPQLQFPAPSKGQQ